MKKLLLATISMLALGLTSAGVVNAQSSSSSTSSIPSSSTQSSAVTSQKHTQSDIRQAQEQLKSTGLYKGKVDGEMGTETKQAISQFQQQRGLNETGDLDEQTLAALTSNQGMTGSSTSPTGNPPSSAGSSSDTLNPATPLNSNR